MCCKPESRRTKNAADRGYRPRQKPNRPRLTVKIIMVDHKRGYVFTVPIFTVGARGTTSGTDSRFIINKKKTLKNRLLPA